MEKSVCFQLKVYVMKAPLKCKQMTICNSVHQLTFGSMMLIAKQVGKIF